MTALYFPAGRLREAALLVLTTSLGDRVRDASESASRIEDDGSLLTVVVSYDTEITLSTGEGRILDFLRALSGHGSVNLHALAVECDAETVATCWKAYAKLLALPDDVVMVPLMGRATR